MELDRTFEERDAINSTIVSSLDEAALNWGVKVLRYEIKDLTPPNEILRSMQAQITAEREARADRRVRRPSPGTDQHRDRRARGRHCPLRGREAGPDQPSPGRAAAVLAIAEATAKAVTQVAEAVRQPGGMEAVNLKVAERYVEAFGNVAKQGNTLILPANLADVGGMIASAMTIVRAPRPAEDPPAGAAR